MLFLPAKIRQDCGSSLALVALAVLQKTLPILQMWQLLIVAPQKRVNIESHIDIEREACGGALVTGNSSMLREN
ncbi:hypothetical protein M2281_003882 [Mesorhizobium soli]|nr:hypothetical protein [Mesorhizobium soli]